MVTSVAQAVDRIKSHWARQFTDESIEDVKKGRNGSVENVAC